MSKRTARILGVFELAFFGGITLASLIGSFCVLPESLVWLCVTVTAGMNSIGSYMQVRDGVYRDYM